MGWSLARGRIRLVLVTNHVLAGALIGRALARHPAGAFAAGVASHFLMDACPHWGTPADQQSYDAFLRVARCDGCAGLAAMALSAGLAPGGSRKAAVAGMVGGAVVDADKPAEHFLGINPFPVWFQRFHKRIQREAPDRLRLEVAVGAALLAAGMAATASGRRARRRSR